MNIKKKRKKKKIRYIESWYIRIIRIGIKRSNKIN